MASVPDMEVNVSPLSDMVGRGGREGAQFREDCLCPVCLEIFMEPVTLPCSHTFCKSCFLESVDKATLCCPMCRKRVSTWARLNSRKNTLVNEELWKQIQTCFPLQCQRRLSGQDAEDEDHPVSVCFPRVSQPGELRQEYEDQVTKLTEERRVVDEEERRASEEYIQRLLAEEEQLLQEERTRKEEDERLARQLSYQLNSPSISQDNLRLVDVTPAKKKEVVVGQIEKFLCPRPAHSSGCSSSSSFLSNKENILLSEVERPVPQLYYYGVQTNRDRQTDLHPASEEEQLPLGSHRSLLISQGGPSKAKRKNSELETTEEEQEEAITKRGCHLLVSSSSSASSSLEVGALALQGMDELEAEMQVRRQQEEDDRRLALLLQKELDQEEKQRATSRRKGTANAYPLRHGPGGKEEASSSGTPNRPSKKTAKTSSTSSALSLKTLKATSSSSNTGYKQTTLTEMLFSLNS